MLVCELIVHYIPSIITDRSEPMFCPVRVRVVPPEDDPKLGDIELITAVCKCSYTTLFWRTLSSLMVISQFKLTFS